jgi:hypothetical protein
MTAIKANYSSRLYTNNDMRLPKTGMYLFVGKIQA